MGSPSVTPRASKWLALVSLLAALAADVAGGGAQLRLEPAEEPGAPRIVQRLARVSRDHSGAIVVLEILEVTPMPTAFGGSSREPLPLLEMPATASQVRLVGGDLSPDQLTQLGGELAVAGPFPAPRLQLAITYAFPAGAELIPLSARLPIDTLLLDVARGSIEARPSPGLRRVEVLGDRVPPRVRYRAVDLAPGSAVQLRLDLSTVDWRHRLAVFMATALAAAFAGLWVWRGDPIGLHDRASSTPPREP